MPHIAAIGQPAPREKTHVVHEPTALLEAIGGVTINLLPKNYGVTVLRTSGEFVLIAREGKTIGYVQKDKLSSIQ